jgi:hypothetical protein
MAMRVVAEVLEGARSTRSHAPRYEPLIRLAEAIRSHRNQKDVFQLLPDELRQVVPFEAMAQYDHTGNRVNWHFSEAYAADRFGSDQPGLRYTDGRNRGMVGGSDSATDTPKPDDEGRKAT